MEITTNGSSAPSKSTAAADRAAERPLRAAFAFLLPLFIASTACAVAEPRLTSGVYEGLTLVVGPGGDVFGYYRESQGEGVVKTCAFFLAGHARGGEATVTTWKSESIPGELRASDGGVVLQIEKGREHPGCGLVLPPLVAAGLPLDRVASIDWGGLAVATAPKAFFYSAPDSERKGKSFVVKGDVLGILSKKSDWFEVEYRFGPKPVRGWIRAADLREVTGP